MPKGQLPTHIEKFYIFRKKDISGISGTGIVAVGVEFPSGKIVIEWTSYQTSIGLYDNMTKFLEVHGHEGNTEIIKGEVPSDKTKRRSKRVSKKKSRQESGT